MSPQEQRHGDLGLKSHPKNYQQITPCAINYGNEETNRHQLSEALLQRNEREDRSHDCESKFESCMMQDNRVHAGTFYFDWLSLLK